VNASAGGAADRHRIAAREIAARLAARFPRAGIGLTGSVALGTNRPDSDLDMVVVDASFGRDAQIATAWGGIPAAIVCLRPRLTPERERAWMVSSGGDARLVSMVRSAQVLRDPDGMLYTLRDTVQRLDAARTAAKDELLARLREHASALLGPAGGVVREEAALVRLLDCIVTGWCIRHDVLDDSKARSREVYTQMEERTPDVAALLRAAIPVSRGSKRALVQAAARVFAPLADA
jgi:hypothetical protein